MRRPSLTSIGLRVLRFQSARRLAQAGPRRITTIGAGGVAGPVDLVAVVAAVADQADKTNRNRQTLEREGPDAKSGPFRFQRLSIEKSVTRRKPCGSRGLLRGLSGADVRM